MFSELHSLLERERRTLVSPMVVSVDRCSCFCVCDTVVVNVTTLKHARKATDLLPINIVARVVEVLVAKNITDACNALLSI